MQFLIILLLGFFSAFSNNNIALAEQPGISRFPGNAPWLYNPAPSRGRGAAGEEGEEEKTSPQQVLGRGSQGQANVQYESKLKDLGEEFSEMGNKARGKIESAQKEASQSIEKSLQTFYANVDKINAATKETSKEVGKSLEMVSKDIEKKTAYDTSFSKYLLQMTNSIMNEIRENSKKLLDYFDKISRIILKKPLEEKAKDEASSENEEHDLSSSNPESNNGGSSESTEIPL